MNVDLKNEPDYERLCEALIEKSKAGKVRWEETANENVFVAAVKGVQTFEVRRVFRSSPFDPVQRVIDPAGSIVENSAGAGRPTFSLTVKDENGREILTHAHWESQSSVAELFRVAQRIASRIDERIEESLELLNRL